MVSQGPPRKDQAESGQVHFEEGEPYGSYASPVQAQGRSRGSLLKFSFLQVTITTASKRCSMHCPLKSTDTPNLFTIQAASHLLTCILYFDAWCCEGIWEEGRGDMAAKAKGRTVLERAILRSIPVACKAKALDSWAQLTGIAE